MESREIKSVAEEQSNSRIATAVDELIHGKLSKKNVEDETYKKTGWDVVRRSSVKELVDSYNKLQYLHPEVTLRPKNVYRRPLNRNSKIRWSKPLKENCEDDYQGHTSDEDITATYVTRIDVQEDTIIEKSENSCDLMAARKPMDKSVRGSLENIREKSIVKKRLEEFSTTQNRHSSSSLTSTDNLDYFNHLRTRLARCSSVVMRNDSSPDSSDNEEGQEVPDTDEENNNIRYKDAPEDLKTRKNSKDDLENHEKLVECYRDCFEQLCNVPFVLAVIYCSCQLAQIILCFLI